MLRDAEEAHDFTCQSGKAAGQQIENNMEENTDDERDQVGHDLVVGDAAGENRGGSKPRHGAFGFAQSNSTLHTFATILRGARRHLQGPFWKKTQTNLFMIDILEAVPSEICRPLDKREFLFGYL